MSAESPSGLASRRYKISDIPFFTDFKNRLTIFQQSFNIPSTIVKQRCNNTIVKLLLNDCYTIVTQLLNDC